jgi:two-component system sensor histidine kinase CreC
VSITSRILLAFAAIAGLAFYFLLDPIIERVERQYLEAAEEPMVDIANVLAAVAEDTWKPSPDFTKIDLAFRRAKARVLRAQIYNLTKTTMDLDAYITDTQGTVLWHSSRPEIVGTDYSRYFDIYFTAGPLRRTLVSSRRE